MKRKKRKNLRFILALLIAKISFFVIKIIDKNRGTNKPGEIALKICPDFLSRIGLPPNIIAVTGTNGKTSITNLINDVLLDQEYTTIINNAGSNMDTGIASTLIAECSLRGKIKQQWGVFEVDERVSPRVYQHIIPKYLLCINLFRDSIKRNGHAEFIFNKINQAIPKETTLILNADDLITSSLQPNNPRLYFAVENVLKKSSKNIVQDIQTCPNCHELLNFQYHHHHHIGRTFCKKCKFSSPKADFICTKIKDELTITEKKQADDYPLISKTIYNIYNQTAVITILRTIGLSPETIKNSLKKSKLITNRENSYQKGKQTITTILAKNQNPISTSLALDYTANLKGNKIFILLVTDTQDKAHGSEDISWLYDSDFEFLNRKDIKQIIVCGSRCFDLSVRLQLAGIKEKTIYYNDNYQNIHTLIKNKNIDNIIIAYELYGYAIAEKIKNNIVGDNND